MKTNTPLPGFGAEIIHVDPASLAVDPQVRGDATPDQGLVESVQAIGIQQPPTVYWDAEREQHVIVMGHRRVGAAIVVGLPVIEVIVRDEAVARDAALVERQLTENLQRKPLTPADEARGFVKAELFGRTPEEIAASVGQSAERVKSALKSVKSANAVVAMEQGIDLEQAAIIADFEGDEETQEHLTGVAVETPHDFARVVAEARNTRAVREAIAPLKEHLDAEGAEIVATSTWDERHWNGDGRKVAWGKGRTLESLGVSPADHSECPGHAAIIDNSRSPETVAIRYVCADYREHHPNAASPQRELTPEEAEREEARARLQEERAQRRTVVAANNTARRDWLRGFIGGRLNQTAGIFDLIADATLDSRRDWEYHVSIAVHILTGDEVESKYEDPRLFEMITAGKITALRGLVANTLGICESHVDDDPSRPELVISYLDRLIGWGYTLSEIDAEMKTSAEAVIAARSNDDSNEGDEDEGEE